MRHSPPDPTGTDTVDPERGLDPLSLQDIIVTLGSPPFIFCLGIAVLVLFHLRRNRSLISGARSFLNTTLWRLDEAVALTMLLVFLLFLARAAVSILLINGILNGEEIVPLSVVMQTALFHLPIIALVIRKARSAGSPALESFGIAAPHLLADVGKGVLAYLAAIPAIAAANAVSYLALQALNIPPEPQLAVRILIDPNPAWLKMYLVAMAVISAPIAEELLFRFVCFPSLARITSPMRSAVMISLLFALIHLNAYAFLPLFVMALALSAAYALTRSIIVPITMHALFNAVNLSIYILYKLVQQNA